ncbi:MAG: DUF1820 family protein [Acidobacteriota bacterium]|nr:DUF1820 family protein [Acidobacteriota bacterium]MDH3785815.1 DUF1820 family protein [Acidobacteriota bacterium]
MSEPIYRAIFHNRGETYEVFAESVHQGDLFGFVCIEGLIFGERTQVVVDPAEERLKTEFEGVQRFFVPMHAIVRIDQVPKRGTARISKKETGDDNVTSFPSSLYTPQDPTKS